MIKFAKWAEIFCLLMTGYCGGKGFSVWYGLFWIVLACIFDALKDALLEEEINRD